MWHGKVNSSKGVYNVPVLLALRPHLSFMVDGKRCLCGDAYGWVSVTNEPAVFARLQTLDFEVRKRVTILQDDIIVARYTRLE